ncbi:MAG: hypothetical protein COT37_01620 [Parcubacteria group bacterium CG08_land_8_20_14_0_20_43_9]|nr:MAG: hypothetical protein COT37_01620 [Parcubacteria group bacterium CG08_land_8_20_14_0_20_43_9]
MIARWHNLSSQEAVKILGSDIEKGLKQGEALERQIEFGKNILPKESPVSRFKVFLSQFRSPLIYILFIAGTIVLFLGDYLDSAVIFGAVLLNTFVGYIQEYKASKALRELKKAIQEQARVLRQGNVKVIDSAELVPGDIFVLQAGDKVPADGRLIKSYDLKINEMALTGEWLASDKSVQALKEEAPLADRDNMVYTGTIVEEGKAIAVATAIGVQTEIGRIALILREIKEEKTPYQKKLSHFSKVVGVVIAFITLIIFFAGLLTGSNFIEMFTVSVAMAVAAVPEGLPVAMTVILALGMQRIFKKKGLARKLISAETLGNASVICTDKTATLTEGKISVSKIFDGSRILEASDSRLIDGSIYRIAILCNEAFVENIQDDKENWVVRGRPTDRAILLFGLGSEFSKDSMDQEWAKIDEVPFNNRKKFLATLHKSDEGKMLLVSGAPENLLAMSGLSEGGRKKWEKKLQEFTSQGLRVICFARKKVSSDIINDSEFEDLEIVCLLGLSDPIRKDAKKAINVCRQAGIKIVMVTGDHRLTAESIAKQLGFKISKESVIEGRELEAMSDSDFQEKVEGIQIYARVEPEHKMKIVKAWQARGEVVAMTGDGINDAPALKQADIGVALGSGTSVAKETSDLVLLNDSFSIIGYAIEEGRAILDNIRKVITHLLADSFTEIILIGGSMLIAKLFGQAWFLPITAVQILWINLIEDGFPGLALAFEPKEDDLMKFRPRGNKAKLLTREMKVIIFTIGFLTDLALLGLFVWFWFKGLDVRYIRTMVFAALAIDSLFYVFSCRSLRKGLFHINILSNRALIGALIFSMITLVAAVHLPAFNHLLGTAPLHFSDWYILFSLGIIELLLIESVKHYFIARHNTEK